MTAGLPPDPFVLPAGESTTAPKATRSGRHRPRVRPYRKHGLTTLRRTVEAIGGRLLDGRTTLAKHLTAWKADLVRDLGGDVSTQQAAVIDLAVRTRLLLDQPRPFAQSLRRLARALNVDESGLEPQVAEPTGEADPAPPDSPAEDPSGTPALGSAGQQSSEPTDTRAQDGPAPESSPT